MQVFTHSWYRVRRLDADLYPSLVIFLMFLSCLLYTCNDRECGICTNVVPMVRALLPKSRETVRSQIVYCVRPGALAPQCEAAAIVMSNTAFVGLPLSAHCKATRMVTVNVVPFYSHTNSSTPP